MTAQSQTAAAQRPTRTDELAAIIRAAAQNRAQVRLTGSDSLPLTRFNPSRPIHTISTLRLHKLLEHAAPDMTIIIQAGMSLEALQKQLAWQNQWLPVDPPAVGGRSPGHRTLGGLIATNSLGPLRFGFGDWRSLIMGMRWIDAAGTVITGGGRTVKNVAGYNTPRLMIGSCGSLAAIAEVTLRTFARPTDERCILFFCDSPGRADALLAAVMESSTTPAYIQAIGGRTFATNPLSLPSGRAGGLVLVVGYTGRPETCTGQLDIVRTLPPARDIECIGQTAAQAGRLRLWLATEPAPTSESVAFRIHTLSSATCALVAALESAQAAGSTWIVSEAGTGIVRGLLTCPSARQRVQDCADPSQLLWTAGVASAPRAISLYDRLKAQLDPASVFGDPAI